MEKFSEVQPLAMTDVQAAKFLGQSVFTLRKHRSLGIGPKYCKLGRSVRYRLGDLKEYVDSSVVAR